MKLHCRYLNNRRKILEDLKLPWYYIKTSSKSGTYIDLDELEANLRLFPSCPNTTTLYDGKIAISRTYRLATFCLTSDALGSSRTLYSNLVFENIAEVEDMRFKYESTLRVYSNLEGLHIWILHAWSRLKYTR